jgi:hypothetical protein
MAEESGTAAGEGTDGATGVKSNGAPSVCGETESGGGARADDTAPIFPLAVLGVDTGAEDDVSI